MKENAMGKRISAVDQYISKAAPFAQPILEHLRELVHNTCPDVVEVMKWSFPCFDYHGEMMCSMASFKAHATFGFWKSSLLPDPHGLLLPIGDSAMGNFGRITALSDLPPDHVIANYIRAHMDLNERGIKVPKGPKKDATPLVVPDDLADALQGNAAAKSTFEGFSNSNKKEYVEWIEEAKSESTRKKRLEQAVEWMAEGKVRNWKYIRK